MRTAGMGLIVTSCRQQHNLKTLDYKRHLMIKDDLQHPSNSLIQEIRSRYPIEHTLDKAFTRKMRRRGESGGDYFDIEATRSQLEICLTAHLGTAVEIVNLRRLTGGASQEQYVFNCARRDGKATGMTDSLVLRREPEEAICVTYRQREFQLLKAADGLVPVPIPYVVDPDGDVFGRPAMI